MKRSLIGILGVSILILAGADWPGFLGAGGRGVATESQPPTQWSSDANVAWKTPLPGRGPSSPIVVDGRVFVTCSAGPNQDRLHVVCLDAQSGTQLWQRQFWATGRTYSHPTSAVAANTPVSDGEAVYAFYSSNDLACVELDGTLRWFRGLTHDYPKAGNDVGMSSSPVIAGDVVVVQIENQGDSFAAGISRQTGETVWRIPRDFRANWSSPAVLPHPSGRVTVILQSPSGLTGVDAADGEQRWHYAADCGTIPTPVVTADGMILCNANGVTMLKPTESDVEVVWQSNRLNPGPASPVYHQDQVYAVNRAGVLSCADAANGETKWQLRLKGTFWASPVLAGSNLFLVNHDGLAQVVKLGESG